MEFSKQCLWDFCFGEVLCCQDTQGEDVKRRHIERTSYSEYSQAYSLNTNHFGLPMSFLSALGKILVHGFKIINYP